MNSKSADVVYRCPSCLLPETKPDLHFNDEGICFACVYTKYAKEEINWAQREDDFHALCESIKDKSESNYDCLIAVSGGKDSMYQTYLVKEIGGLNPLLVSFEPSCPTEIGQYNLNNMADVFNCDLIQMKKSPSYQKLAKLGFDVVGDHEWPNHVGIYCWPVQMAVKMGIKTIFYGEGGGYIGLGRWDVLTESREISRDYVEQYIGMNGIRITDMLEFDSSLSKKDLLPYIYPSKDDIERIGIKSVTTGNYFHWDTMDNIKKMKNYGWKTSPNRIDGTFGNWEDLDCGFMPYHQYFKFIKYGYSRATDHASYELRHGRLTKAEAKELILKYDSELPKNYFPELLDFLNIKEEYFFDTVDRFANPKLFLKGDNGRFLRKWDGELFLNDHYYTSLDNA